MVNLQAAPLHPCSPIAQLVKDRGWNLSEGQNQQLALARAIPSKLDILILDEATSARDSQSEQLIQKYMDAIRRTNAEHDVSPCVRNPAKLPE